MMSFCIFKMNLLPAGIVYTNAMNEGNPSMTVKLDRNSVESLMIEYVFQTDKVCKSATPLLNGILKYVSEHPEILKEIALIDLKKQNDRPK